MRSCLYMTRYVDPCADPPTTLYLVSAEKRGIKYWKTGITSKDDPIQRDSKHYKEVFRSEKVQWRGDAEGIEINIARTFYWIMFKSRMEGYIINDPPAREGLSYDFPLEVSLEVFDWWHDLAESSDRVPNPDYDPECGNAKYLLTSCRYSNGFQTAFDFCWSQMKNGAGFDFENSIYKDHGDASLDCLGNAFGWRYEKGVTGFQQTGTLAQYREYAVHFYTLVDQYIPQLQKLLRFRPDKPALEMQVTEPMWD